MGHEYKKIVPLSGTAAVASCCGADGSGPPAVLTCEPGAAGHLKLFSLINVGAVGHFPKRAVTAEKSSS